MHTHTEPMVYQINNNNAKSCSVCSHTISGAVHTAPHLVTVTVSYGGVSKQVLIVSVLVCLSLFGSVFFTVIISSDVCEFN